MNHTDKADRRRRRRNKTRVEEEFLAVLGHELRNPLAPIFTAVHMLREKGVRMGEVDVIERQAAHMTRLVEDLLDVSRITRGKITLHKRLTDVATIVAHAIESSSPLIESRRHRLEVEIPEGLHVDVDLDRLSQVVANLLTNASKYSPPGTTIHVGATGDDARVTIEVTDEGEGIAPGIGERVFELFVQEEQSSERKRGGLGLGLPIVRHLTQLHHGTVHFTSPVAGGRGTRFVVTLPRVDAVPSPRAEAPESAPSRVPDRRRVLVVDDNEDSALLLSGALARRGFDVEVAHDGLEALRVAAAFVPDVAVLDIGLPVMDGHELAARLRREVSRDIRFVALTGYARPSDRRRSREAGFAHHLVKPVDIAALVEILCALVEGDGVSSDPTE